MRTKRFVVLALVLSFALLLGACSQSIDVADLEIEGDLSDVAETETGLTATDVTCPETIEEPTDGVEFTCDIEMDDGSTLTANLTLEEDDEGTFQTTFQGFEE